MDNFICGGYIFSSNFDSGNLHKVELTKWNEGTLPNNDVINTEFNLWTKPDCAGTPYENLNRSWFLFSIQGGDPNKICKLNIVNLNKQAKLYSQGMQPVIRIGDTGKWERIRDNIKYNIVNGDYVLSFLHKPYANTSTKFYYAFTFPYTYGECQDQLQTYDELYEKSETETKYIVQRLNVDVNSNSSVYNEEAIGDHDYCEQSSKDGKTVDNSKKLKIQSNGELENDIYYRRELLVNSLEGRRIDLLTITSFHNIREGCESRVGDLFPDHAVKRCQLFENKKVIFMSARVHPGETPASFILNGFLKMILDRKSRYAAVLRQMYIFKIIPFLNPDGVFNGYYRSDTMGHNLNRVYLGPTKDIHPSIYAVRKLIIYYHNGMKDTAANNLTSAATDDSCAPAVFDDIEIPVLDLDNGPKSRTATQAFAPHTMADDKLAQPNILSEINVQAKNNRNADELDPTPSTSASASETPTPTPTPTPTATSSPSASSSSSSSLSNSMQPAHFARSVDGAEYVVHRTTPLALANDDTKTTAAGTTVFNNEFIVELKQSISMESALPLSPKDATASAKGKVKVKKMELKKCLKSLGYGPELSASTGQRVAGDSSATARSANSSLGSSRLAKKHSKKDAAPLLATPKTSNASSAQSALRPLRRRYALDGNNSDNANVPYDPNAVNDQSNIFLYVDLHGHASKKGIFMYGNYLPNTAEAVECMLLPRLMSLNCLHFHFDACVFSERNMYHKGKRDGLSKEGSGRVAVYKAIGLIKCYTLEGNYNMGKCVNVLPPLPKESKKYSSSSAIPPKFTPSIFEEVGRALGPSILDLTESNPLSRLRSSEFRNLHGLRNSIRNDIERNTARPETASSKASRTHSKPICSKTSTACYSSLTTDGFKENKGRHATNKPSISFGKKEKPPGVPLIRKKGKMAGDSMATTSTTAPIPMKRPKVLPKAKCGPAIGVGTADPCDPADVKHVNIALTKGIIRAVMSAAKPPPTPNAAAAAGASTDDPAGKQPFGEPAPPQSAYSVDAEKPSCSYHMQPAAPQSFHFDAKKTGSVLKPGTFMRKSKSASTSKLFKQPATAPASKHPASKMKRNTFGGAGTTGSRMKATLRRANISPEGRRKKKKKSLKAELKRTVF